MCTHAHTHTTNKHTRKFLGLKPAQENIEFNAESGTSLSFQLMDLDGKQKLRVPEGSSDQVSATGVTFDPSRSHTTQEVLLAHQGGVLCLRAQGRTQAPRAQRKAVLLFLVLLRLLPQGGEDGEPAHFGVHHAIQAVGQRSQQGRVLLFYLVGGAEWRRRRRRHSEHLSNTS